MLLVNKTQTNEISALFLLVLYVLVLLKTCTKSRLQPYRFFKSLGETLELPFLRGLLHGEEREGRRTEGGKGRGRWLIAISHHLLKYCALSIGATLYATVVTW